MFISFSRTKSGVAVLNFLHDPPLSDGTFGADPSSITLEEHHRMVEAGKITKEDKVELIRGRLVKKEPKTPLHSATVGLLGKRLRVLMPTEWFAQEEKPITLADSEPEPDVSVARERSDEYFEHHPQAGDLALVVEVSISSLDFNRNTKRSIYAEAGIPYYWIVNLVDLRIEVYSEPSLGDYRKVIHRAKDDPVSIIVDKQEIGSIALAEFTPRTILKNPI